MERDTRTLEHQAAHCGLIESLWRPIPRRYLSALIIAWVLVASLFLAQRASMHLLKLVGIGFGILVLLRTPRIGLLGLIVAALVVPMEIATGTEVRLNVATALIPLLFILWLLESGHRHDLQWPGSDLDRPLALFLAAGLLSLMIGNATWDPAIPRSGSFWMVQLTQWGIFAFSAGAFWLTGNLIRDEVWLQRLAFLFLSLAGCLTVVFVLNMVTLGSREFLTLFNRSTTIAFYRPALATLLTGLAGGQLLFNQALCSRWRLFLWAVIGACLIYAFHLQRATASYWVAVAAVLGVLAWLRWPGMRWPVVGVLLILVSTGFLSSVVYDFAGGAAEWQESGGSRLALIERVVQVTMRNPITGLGPAAYRLYAGMEPLYYRGAYWDAPLINSHNNYVDLFSQVGLLGLLLFFWFAVEVARLGLHLRATFRKGFSAGYVNGMLAVGVASLVLMMLADWILPFVYNIGLPGFQASVLVWLFLGGLVSLDQIAHSGTDT